MAKPPVSPQFKVDDFPDTGLSTSDAMDRFFSTLNVFGDQTAAALAALTFNDNFDSEVKVITIQTPSTAWTTVAASSLLNSWTNTGGFSTAYRVYPDTTIAVRGNVASGTANSVIFNLPKAMWPGQDVNFGTESNSAFGKVVVRSSDGAVKQAAGTANLALDCIRFEPAVPVPYVMSCFPVSVACTLEKVGAVFALQVLDTTSTTQKPMVLGGVNWVATDVGYSILNIPGLGLNTNYKVTLVAIGG